MSQNPLETVAEIAKLTGALSELAERIIAAATSENPSRVQDVLPPQLETSIVKMRADIEAAKKFGERG